jgi:hypothetical protein
MGTGTRATHLPAALLQIGLVAEHNEGKRVRIARRSVHEELVAPRLQVLERLRVSDLLCFVV